MKLESPYVLLMKSYTFTMCFLPYRILSTWYSNYRIEGDLSRFSILSATSLFILLSNASYMLPNYKLDIN